MLELRINGTLLDNATIKAFPNIVSEWGYSDRLIAETIDIELDNIDPTNYDDRDSDSIFYGADWYDWPVTVYDSLLELYLYNGTLRNITTSETVCKLTVNNYKQLLANTNCTYDNSAGADETPAEAIKNILIAAGIQETDLLIDSFDYAIDVQTAATVYAVLRYNAEDNINCLAVIDELCRITTSYLYSINNHIGLYSWSAWAGEIGTEIDESDILPDSYSQTYNISRIKNDYSILYDAGSAAITTGQDAASIAKYGTLSFVIPPTEIEADSMADYKVLLGSEAAATWCGARVLSRYKNIEKKVEFEMAGDKIKALVLFDFLRLNFSPFVNEPCQIEKITYNTEKETAKIEGYFVNTPTQVIARDETPPDPVEVVAAIPTDDNGAVVKWTKSLATDLLGYKVYMASSKGQWDAEGNYGPSPIDVKNPSESIDGYCYLEISQLSPGVKYYFYVTAYDTSYNESDDSNVLSCTILNNTSFNHYRVSGDITAGITVKELNTAGGSVLSTWSLYGTAKYGENTYSPASLWQSGIYYNEDGFTGIRWRVSSSNHMTVEYRQSDDNSTWDSWTSVDALVVSGVVLSKKYMQYRVLFNPTYWSDTDTFYLINLR